MKPTSLRPGDRVTCDDARHVYTIVRRDRSECGRRGMRHRCGRDPPLAPA